MIPFGILLISSFLSYLHFFSFLLARSRSSFLRSLSHQLPFSPSFFFDLFSLNSFVLFTVLPFSFSSSPFFFHLLRFLLLYVFLLGLGFLATLDHNFFFMLYFLYCFVCIVCSTKSGNILQVFSLVFVEFVCICIRRSCVFYTL